MADIKDDKDLDIALKEYELATQHYFHEDKMKTDSLKNSIIATITMMSVVITIISTNYITDKILKIGFSFIMGFIGILISVGYGAQYRRILKHQEIYESRLEKLEKIIKESHHFEIRTTQDVLELMKPKESHASKSRFKSVRTLGLASFSSSNWFKVIIPGFIIGIWIALLIAILAFYSYVDFNYFGIWIVFMIVVLIVSLFFKDS